MSSTDEVRPTSATSHTANPPIRSAREDLQQGHDADEQRPRSPEAIDLKGPKLRFEEQVEEQIQRDVDTVAKLDVEFSLYWIKANPRNQDLNRELERLCRQQDILCYNAGGEFIAILTGANDSGVRGFEARIDKKLGDLLRDARRGFAVHRAGEPTENYASKALVTAR